MQLGENPTSGSLSEWYIRVDCQGNPPQQFNSQDIGKLFQDHVGAVVNVSECVEGGKKWIKVSLSGEDDLKKALCLSGYAIGDTNIQVSVLSNRQIPSFAKPRIKHPFKSKRDPDARRNLYVLNVPHDLSLHEYRTLFTPHGTPTHTVLLKTQDSCSRRRGFVVMSSHDEAQDVINWLDGICIRGFQLRVNWANIDRSNGFMSGYDRINFLGQNGTPSPEPNAPVQNTSIEPTANGIGMDTKTVVASNIPISLFPEHEIDILFKPFGLINNIQVIPPGQSTLAPASPFAQTVIVTYDKAADAIAAKNILHGQVYEGFSLAVGYVSNLGKESHQGFGANSAFYNAASLSQNPASYCHFDGGQISSSPATFEQTFRGLPRDPYETVKIPYPTEFSRRPDFSNWCYSPYMPQMPPHQAGAAFHPTPSFEQTMHLPHPRSFDESHHSGHYSAPPTMPW